MQQKPTAPPKIHRQTPAEVKKLQKKGLFPKLSDYNKALKKARGKS